MHSDESHAASDAECSSKRLFAVCASWIGCSSGNESNRLCSEKCDWWRRGCNSTHTGGEASTCPSKGWRVSDTALGVTLKAHQLGLGALLRLGNGAYHRCTHQPSAELDHEAQEADADATRKRRQEEVLIRDVQPESEACSQGVW